MGVLFPQVGCCGGGTRGGGLRVGGAVARRGWCTTRRYPSAVMWNRCPWSHHAAARDIVSALLMWSCSQ
eukprot:5438650-Prorocentrum_lima.AAC.1